MNEMRSLLQDRLMEIERRLDSGTTPRSDDVRWLLNALRVGGWYACAHQHRWQSTDNSTRCPVCGTTTFFGPFDAEESVKRNA